VAPSQRAAAEIIIIIIHLIYIALFEVLIDTFHVSFTHRRLSHRELFRVKCLAQGHIAEGGD